MASSTKSDARGVVAFLALLAVGAVGIAGLTVASDTVDDRKVDDWVDYDPDEGGAVTLKVLNACGEPVEFAVGSGDPPAVGWPRDQWTSIEPPGNELVAVRYFIGSYMTVQVRTVEPPVVRKTYRIGLRDIANGEPYDYGEHDFLLNGRWCPRKEGLPVTSVR